VVIEDVDDDEEDEEEVLSSLGWRIWEDGLASTGADPSMS
jgi:hypothetical protein